MQLDWQSLGPERGLDGQTKQYLVLQGPNHVWAVDRRSGSFFQLVEGYWEKRVGPREVSSADRGQPLDRGSEFATSGESQFIVEPDGLVWSASPGGDWSCWLAPESSGQALGGSPSGVGWDPVESRLVSPNVQASADGSSAAERGWQPLSGFESGSRSVEMVGTTAGVFAASDRQVWRLVGEVWQCVGRDDRWEVTALTADPTGELLLAVAFAPDASFGDDDERLVYWTVDGWRQFAELPETMPMHTFKKGEGNIAVDVTDHRLVMLATGARGSLALGSLDVPDAAFPSKPLSDQHRRKPQEYRVEPIGYREARLVVPDDGTKPVDPSDTSWSDDLPDGYSLVGVLPVGGKTAVVAVADDWSDSEYWERAAVGGRGFKGTFADISLSGEPSDPYVLVDGTLRRVELEPFRERQVAIEVDGLRYIQDEVLEAPEADHSSPRTGTKIGGYGCYMQGRPEGECKECGERLEFAMQFAPDIFGRRFSEYLYVFVCPNQCSTAADIQFT